MGAEKQTLHDAFYDTWKDVYDAEKQAVKALKKSGKPARAKTCEAMLGSTSEMEEDMDDFGDSPAADAVLTACA